METTFLQTLLREKGMRLSGLARAVGVDKATTTRWSRSRVPAERLADVETATGIPREVLRPDIFRTETAQ